MRGGAFRPDWRTRLASGTDYDAELWQRVALRAAAEGKTPMEWIISVLRKAVEPK